MCLLSYSFNFIFENFCNKKSKERKKGMSHCVYNDMDDSQENYGK